MSIDLNNSLKNLGENTIGGETFSSSLATSCEQLLLKPIGELSDGELRLLIGQNIGLPFLIPLALSRLSENPFIKGDYYPGDLLQSVLNIDKGLWGKYPDMYIQLCEVTGGLREILRHLDSAIARFEEIESLTE